VFCLRCVPKLHEAKTCIGCRQPDVVQYMQMASISQSSSNVWSSASIAYAPQFVKDHVLAIVLMLVFYASESALVGPSVDQQRSNVAHFMAQLPKVLVPLKFTALKRFWLRFSGTTATELRPYNTGACCARLCQLPSSEIPAAMQYCGSLAEVMEAAAASVLLRPQFPGFSQPSSAPQEGSQAGTITEESPFVKDRPARPGLAPGQWDPALGGAAQAEVAKQNYLEGMYYCIGVAPAGGLRSGQVYDAFVMGTRVALWKGVPLSEAVLHAGNCLAPAHASHVLLCCR
jgi:hypothetical protein